MHIKMGYNITTFKNAFPYKMAKFSNVKLKLLLHQLNTRIQPSKRACKVITFFEF